MTGAQDASMANGADPNESTSVEATGGQAVPTTAGADANGIDFFNLRQRVRAARWGTPGSGIETDARGEKPVVGLFKLKLVCAEHVRFQVRGGAMATPRGAPRYHWSPSLASARSRSFSGFCFAGGPYPLNR